MALTLMLNGQARVFAELSTGISVAELLSALALKSDRVAVELNGEIAPRDAWRDREVHEGDRLEIVHFVGGGSGLPAMR